MRRSAIVLGAIVGAFVVFALLFQWNWLRGPLAWALEERLHRPVSITGDLEVHPWSLSPWGRVNGLIIGNPSGQSRQTTVVLPRLTVKTRWLSLLKARPELVLLWAERPRLRLVDETTGRANGSALPSGFPEIDHLVISDGVISLADSRYRLRFNGGISSNETRDRATGPNDTIIDGALIVDSPAWVGAQPLLEAPRVLVRLKLLPSMVGRLSISLVDVAEPRILLMRDASGRANWQFPGAKTPSLPPIGRVVLSRGALRYDDARLQSSFLGSVSTDEAAAGIDRGSFLLQGRGTFRRTPFITQIHGGPLINIDPLRPYRFDAFVKTGGTSVTVDAALAHPFDLRRASGRLHARGLDVADLYHLTGVALPITPPYDLAAGFARRDSYYALGNIAGRVGDSDLAGSLSVDDTTGRPFLTADLSSRRLNLADLTALVGGVPKHPVGHTLSPAQRAMSAKLSAEHRILPDAHLDVARIRTTDARVFYRAWSVRTERFPVRGLVLKLALDRGQLTIDPLTMSLPQGDLSAKVRLDARGSVPSEAVDVRLANARLENLIGRGGANPPLEGGLYARARLSGRGDSVRAAAASADGEVTVVIPNGEVRQAFAELLGIDVTKGLFLLITKDQKETPIRCAVADFQARAGVLTARKLVFDTGVVLATGGGDVDLRDESLNLQLAGKPKKFRLVRIGAPITVKGSLASPRFGVDAGKAAGQLTIGALLGTAVAPLSALLPFINPGLSKNADCAALVHDAEETGAPLARR